MGMGWDEMRWSENWEGELAGRGRHVLEAGYDGYGLFFSADFLLARGWAEDVCGTSYELAGIYNCNIYRGYQ
jgi:hypothetical protein